MGSLRRPSRTIGAVDAYSGTDKRRGNDRFGSDAEREYRRKSYVPDANISCTISRNVDESVRHRSCGERERVPVGLQDRGLRPIGMKRSRSVLSSVVMGSIVRSGVCAFARVRRLTRRVCTILIVVMFVLSSIGECTKRLLSGAWRTNKLCRVWDVRKVLR